MNWEKLCPNLRFSAEKKMENLHKKGWSDVKLKLNDWDILFPKILRISQRIFKNEF